MKKLIAFLNDEDGAALIEYVLLAALIGVAAVTTMGLVGTQADAKLDEARVAMGGTP